MNLALRCIAVIIVLFLISTPSKACSTFKLQKGEALVYGHNLNEADIGVPGLIFINKRGTFKTGRTWDEIVSKEPQRYSSHTWISRYGSVTFNNFGRDFPDGGMNEAGLYVWEMNEDAGYPKNDSLPKLNQMNWMQYILDNYSTLEEAVRCASEIEIDGWGWHFFMGDGQGNTAAVEFIDGKVVVHQGAQMPVPALFNSRYEREMELLKYFKPYGGDYEVDMDDPEIPRFVKADQLIKAYQPSDNIVDYGFYMLDKIKVNDEPEWSVLFDVRQRNVYFKTRLNPAIKSFSMQDIDFSNQEPVLIMNMDISDGGDVLSQFLPYSNEEMRKFTKESLFPIVPEGFFTRGGLTLDEYLGRVSTHSDLASSAEKQFFKGRWLNEKDKLTVAFNSEGDMVTGTISNPKDTYPIEHLSMMGNHVRFTFRTKGKRIIEMQATINGNEMVMHTYGTEDDYGERVFYRE